MATAVVDVSDNLGGVVYSRAQLTVVVRGVATVALSSGDTRLNVQTTDTNIALYSVTLSGGRAASALRLSQQGSSNAALTAVIRNNTIAVVSLATNLAVGVHSVTLQGTDGVSSLTTQIAVNSFVAINYANALQTLSVATGATLVLAAATPRNGVGAQRYSLIAGTSANRFSVVVGSGELRLTAGLTGIAPANLATAVVEVSDSLSKATLSVIVESYQLSFGGANLIVARVLEEANPTGVLGESVRLTVLSGTTGEVYLVSVSSIPVLPSQISLLGSSDTNLTARIGIGLSQAFIQIENPLLAGSQNTLTLSGTNGLSTLTVRFMVKAYTDVSYSPSQQTLEMVSGFTGAVAGVLQPQGGGLGSFVYALGSETTASQFAINSSSGGLSLIARLAVNALATAVVDVSDNLGGVVYSRAQLTVVVRGVAAVALSSGDTRLNVQTTDTNIALYSVTLSGGRAASALRLSQQGSSNAALTAVIRNNTIAVVSLATNLAVGVHSVTLQGTDGVSSLTTQIAVNSFVAINYANALQTLSVATGATLVLAAATPRNGVGAQRYSLIAGTSANRFSVVVGSGELRLTAGLTGIAPANLATAVVEVSDSLSKGDLERDC